MAPLPLVYAGGFFIGYIELGNSICMTYGAENVADCRARVRATLERWYIADGRNKKITLSMARSQAYTTCIDTIQRTALENLSKSQQVLGAKGYVYIPDPVVEQTDDGLVRVSVGDQIACISTTQPVQPTVHQLTV